MMDGRYRPFFLNMHMQQKPFTPSSVQAGGRLSPQMGEGDRPRRFYSLSLWERVGVRAYGLI